ERAGRRQSIRQIRHSERDGLDFQTVAARGDPDDNNRCERLLQHSRGGVRVRIDNEYYDGGDALHRSNQQGIFIIDATAHNELLRKSVSERRPGVPWKHLGFRTPLASRGIGARETSKNATFSIVAGCGERDAGESFERSWNQLAVGQ